MPKGIVLCIAIMCVSGLTGSIHAQSSFDEYKRKAFEQFEQYKAEKQQEFDDYRARVNSEYEEYMRRAWQEFKTMPAIPVPPSPEPPAPPVVPPDAVPEDKPLPKGDVIPAPVPVPPPAPLLPEDEPENKPTPPVKRGDALTFNYYGTDCTVPYDKSLRFALRSTEENSVADAWRKLSAKESVDLVKQCVALRDRMKLSDWGYLRLVEKLSAAAYPGRKNEAALLQMFILAQSGYKVRIGRCDGRLTLLVPCDASLYNYSYLIIDGEKYFIADRTAGSGGVHVYDRKFPREQKFSLDIRQQPQLAYTPASLRRFRSELDPAIDLELAVNKNLIDFYNEYPLSGHWNIYAVASLSEKMKEELYPVLRAAIEGKSEKAAADVLLHFVQTAFEYKTDGEQFGDERPLFPDETFFYPYSDCEDRAILFAALVRELMGLDVVLLYYPGHLASAVNFSEPVSGSYFDIDGRRYTVCDPTYIGADSGMAMPQFKDTAARIVKL